MEFKKIEDLNLMSVHSVGKEKPEKRWVSKMIGYSIFLISLMVNPVIADENENGLRHDLDGTIVLANPSLDYSEFKDKKNVEDKQIGIIRVNDGQGSLPVYELDTFIGMPNESKRSFLIRVGSALHQFAQQVNFEGCGKLAYREDTNQWGVVLTTHRSHLGCVVVDKLPPGMASAEMTIHNHPEVDRFRINSQDVNFLGRPNQLGKWQNSSHNLGFSQRDLEGMAGFVIDKGHLFYHNGNKEVEALGSLNNLRAKYENLNLAENSIIKKTPSLLQANR